MERAVYNLEFRPNCQRMVIDDYIFERVPNYAEQHAKLQHLVRSSGTELSTKVQTGGHAHTANVVCPVNDRPAIIPWQHHNPTALDDIVLLLRLFTRRDVFVEDSPVDETCGQFAITADPRQHPWGGILVCSIPYESDKRDAPFNVIDTTLSVHLPQIYERMRSPLWQSEHGRGYFLVLLNKALQQWLLEAAFGQCWTIWEHLFACLTDRWMSSEANSKLGSKEKIAFLLIHFGVRENLADKEKSRLADLVEIRNRLIHFGQFPVKDSVHADARLFIRMTEYIAAKALGLFPSNVFNTIERLEEFLSNDLQRIGRSV